MTEQNENEKLEILRAAGVFDMQSGKFTVDVHNGQFQAVRTEELKYRRRELSPAQPLPPKKKFLP